MHSTFDIGILVCVAIIAAAVATQTLMMLGMAVGALRMRKRMSALVKRVEEDLLPMIKTVRGMVDDMAPKAKTASDEVVEASRTMRQKVDQASDTLSDILKKTHTQVNRVDETLAAVMGGLGRAGGKVQKATGGTSRKWSAVMTGLRVATDVLRTRRQARQDSQAGTKKR